MRWETWEERERENVCVCVCVCVCERERERERKREKCKGTKCFLWGRIGKTNENKICVVSSFFLRTFPLFQY